MQFAFTDEQLMIRESARTFLDAEAALPAVRAASVTSSGYDAHLWQQMTQELGWSAIAIPEVYGGAGLGFVELAILAHEQGRRLLPSPFFATVCLAAPVIMQLGREEQRAQWLSAIAGGSLKAALALSNQAGHADIGRVASTLTRSGADWVLSGDAHFVVSAADADLLLVVARVQEPGVKEVAVAPSVRVVAVSPKASGVRLQMTEMLDVTRPMSSVAFDQVAVSADALLGLDVDASAGLQRALDQARVVLSAEAVGGAEYSLEAVTAYVKERVQFGRAIGSFQAIKHRLADSMVLVEAAKSMAWYAACAADESSDQDLAMAASQAKSCCADAFNAVAANAIQLHGGIGFTWDHHAHLYFKRARASSMLLGSPAWHRERVACGLGLGSISSALQF